MKEKSWYEVFLNALQEKFPKKAQLTQELMDLLCLEREAVYRRLRNDVAFLAQEVVKIASAWNISIDEIIGIHTGNVVFQMQPFNYLDPSKKEFHNIASIKDKDIDYVRTSVESEYMEVSNRIPRALIIGFQTLYRFRIFNWASQYCNDTTHREFAKVTIPEEMLYELEDYKKTMVQVKNTHYIFDQGMFDYMVHCAIYFHSILLLTDNEKELIKKELHGLLDYLIEVANKGYYPETQNKVSMYISQINIDTNYSYLYTDKLKTCRVQTFGKFDVSSYDVNMVSQFRTWMNLKKRSAIQISEVNEKQRIEYFTKQRRLVDRI
jgi:hypothetical protein